MGDIANNSPDANPGWKQTIRRQYQLMDMIEQEFFNLVNEVQKKRFKGEVLNSIHEVIHDFTFPPSNRKPLGGLLQRIYNERFLWKEHIIFNLLLVGFCSALPEGFFQKNEVIANALDVRPANRTKAQDLQYQFQELANVIGNQGLNKQQVFAEIPEVPLNPRNVIKQLWRLIVYSPYSENSTGLHDSTAANVAWSNFYNLAADLKSISHHVPGGAIMAFPAILAAYGLQDEPGNMLVTFQDTLASNYKANLGVLQNITHVTAHTTGCSQKDPGPNHATKNGLGGNDFNACEYCGERGADNENGINNTNGRKYVTRTFFPYVVSKTTTRPRNNLQIMDTITLKTWPFQQPALGDKPIVGMNLKIYWPKTGGVNNRPALEQLDDNIHAPPAGGRHGFDINGMQIPQPPERGKNHGKNPNEIGEVIRILETATYCVQDQLRKLNQPNQLVWDNANLLQNLKNAANLVIHLQAKASGDRDQAKMPSHVIRNSDPDIGNDKYTRNGFNNAFQLAFSYKQLLDANGKAEKNDTIWLKENNFEVDDQGGAGTIKRTLVDEDKSRANKSIIDEQRRLGKFYKGTNAAQTPRPAYSVITQSLYALHIAKCLIAIYATFDILSTVAALLSGSNVYLSTTPEKFHFAYRGQRRRQIVGGDGKKRGRDDNAVPVMDDDDGEMEDTLPVVGDDPGGADDGDMEQDPDGKQEMSSRPIPLLIFINKVNTPNGADHMDADDEDEYNKTHNYDIYKLFNVNRTAIKEQPLYEKIRTDVNNYDIIKNIMACTDYEHTLQFERKQVMKELEADKEKAKENIETYRGEEHGIDDDDIDAENEYWDDIISETKNKDLYINLPVKSNIYREVMDRQRPVNTDDIKLPFTSDINRPYTEEHSLEDSTKPSIATQFALDRYQKRQNNAAIVPDQVEIAAKDENTIKAFEENRDAALGRLDELRVTGPAKKGRTRGGKSKKHTRKKRQKHTRKKHNKKKKTKRKNKKKTKKRRR